MFKKQSITGRVAVSKTIGFVAGILVLLTLPLVPVATSLEFKIGFVLLIILMSVTIGLLGVYTQHPVFSGLKLTWWVRGPMVGAVFFLLLVLLAKDELGPFMSLDIVAWTGLTSPYWAVLDGIILGGLIGYVTTKVNGEGALPIT